jgi:hypothetical protein
MERDLWSREDLRNAIRATYYAGVVSPPAGDELEACWYAEGFRAALTALALHLGLPPVGPTSGTPPRPQRACGAETRARLAGA